MNNSANISDCKSHTSQYSNFAPLNLPIGDQPIFHSRSVHSEYSSNNILDNLQKVSMKILGTYSSVKQNSFDKSLQEQTITPDKKNQNSNIPESSQNGRGVKRKHHTTYLEVEIIPNSTRKLIVRCNNCNIEFDKNEAFDAHAYSVHERCVCVLCQLQFSNTKARNKHNNYTNQTTKYNKFHGLLECLEDNCNIMLPSISTYNKHKNYHLYQGMPENSCRTCKLHYKTKPHLQAHIKHKAHLINAAKQLKFAKNIENNPETLNTPEQASAKGYTFTVTL